MTGRPDSLPAAHSIPRIDPLSDVLRVVRLSGALFFAVKASSPWIAGVPDGAAIVPVVLPRAQHVISYHVITRGRCWVALADGDPVELEAGDILVLPRGDSYCMAASPTPERPKSAQFESGLGVLGQIARGALPFELHTGTGAGPPDMEVVCGFMGCDVRPFNPLLVTLPRLLCLKRGAGDPDGRISQLLRFAVSEASEPSAGGECVRLRVSELMFVEVVRRHLATLPLEHTSWLAGLRDPDVGRAVGLLHERVADAWTLDKLAKEVGASRSALAERFAYFVGHPPMHYLAQWRMQVAARLLSETTTKVAAVALAVGYDSEAAFSRAFKKSTGTSPSVWRARQGVELAAAPVEQQRWTVEHGRVGDREVVMGRHRRVRQRGRSGPADA